MDAKSLNWSEALDKGIFPLTMHWECVWLLWNTHDFYGFNWNRGEVSASPSNQIGIFHFASFNNLILLVEE